MPKRLNKEELIEWTLCATITTQDEMYANALMDEDALDREDVSIEEELDGRYN